MRVAGLIRSCDAP